MLLLNSYTESKQLASCCFQSVAVGLNKTLTWNTNVHITFFGLINQLNNTTHINTNTYCIICPESCVQSMMTLPIYNLCQLICIVIIYKSSQGRAEKNTQCGIGSMSSSDQLEQLTSDLTAGIHCIVNT